MMKDLTERKLVYLDDALDALNEYFARIGKLKRRGLTIEEKAIHLDTVDAIKALPPAQPERESGEWLRMSDLSEKDDNRYKCSRCGNVVHHKSWVDLYTFNSWCGRCGSDNSRHTT